MEGTGFVYSPSDLGLLLLLLVRPSSCEEIGGGALRDASQLLSCVQSCIFRKATLNIPDVLAVPSAFSAARVVYSIFLNHISLWKRGNLRTLWTIRCFPSRFCHLL